MNRKLVTQIILNHVVCLLFMAAFTYGMQQRFNPNVAYWRLFISYVLPWELGLAIWIFFIRPIRGLPPYFRKRDR